MMEKMKTCSVCGREIPQTRNEEDDVCIFKNRTIICGKCYLQELKERCRNEPEQAGKCNNLD